jgi:hypothetical protein
LAAFGWSGARRIVVLRDTAKDRQPNQTEVTLIETALALDTKVQAWQGTADTDSLYILIASLLLAFIAFVILTRARF